MKKRDLHQYVGLMDCNNFFVSCERLFRPDLTHTPVVVLSSNDGCIIARSNEVKALGVPMGIPYFEVKDMLRKHEVVVFSSNFALYRDISSRVMKALACHVDGIEVYSIDEAFFTVQAEDAERVGRIVREKIRTWVGIPVSIGIAETKTLAKYAGSVAKGGAGVHVLTGDRRETVEPLSVGALWGVGSKTTENLARYGVRTVGDVISRGPSSMRDYLGVAGERLYYELTGTPSLAHHTEEVQQSIMSTRSFGKKTSQYGVVEDAVSYHIASVAKTLRDHGWVAERASLFLRYTDEEERARSLSYIVSLSLPTADTSRIAKDVLAVLRQQFTPRFRYTKSGITLSGIIPAEEATLSLFSAPRESARNVMEVFDTINRKFGSDTLRIGTERQHHEWRAKSAFLSPSYTTSWTELRAVKGH